MRRILLIGTGGTIACRQTADGLAPALSAAELLAWVPGAGQVCHTDFLQLMNLDSTNMAPAHWQAISRCIRQHYDAYDGFVVAHGTDTLAYTAAALSYMVQRSRKPIVLTGAQRPIDVDSTDARQNLLDSLLYAADPASQDVNIVFDGKVIAGTRAKKERAKSYNAFSSINFPCPALIQDGRIIRYVPSRPYGPDEVRFYHALNDAVALWKLVPGARPEMLAYLLAHYDCLVIESFGVGGIPEGLTGEFYAQMARWRGCGKQVVMATQVVSEGSNMAVYEVGKRVKQDFGLLEAYDMTLEAVITKMMWLMARGLSDEELKREFYREINHDILFTR